MSDKWFCQIGIGVYAECVKLLQQGWYGVLVDADPMTFAKMYSHLESELATPLFQRLTFINTAITGKDELIEFASYLSDSLRNVIRMDSLIQTLPQTIRNDQLAYP